MIPTFLFKRMPSSLGTGSQASRLPSLKSGGPAKNLHNELRGAVSDDEGWDGAGCFGFVGGAFCFIEGAFGFVGGAFGFVAGAFCFGCVGGALGFVGDAFGFVEGALGFAWMCLSSSFRALYRSDGCNSSLAYLSASTCMNSAAAFCASSLSRSCSSRP